MTHFTFWDDTYLTTLDTQVESVEGNEVILKETIAYAEAGGQESDRVTINGIEVLNSSLDPQKRYIIYTLPEGHNLKPNDSITMSIDWNRRYSHMRLHFACELILVLMNRHFAKIERELKPEEIDNVGIEKMGAHMSEDKARIDFKMTENISTYFPMLMKEIEKIVESDIPIETGYIDRDKRKRYWRIPELATVPCGGTHVKSTAEIGRISLRRKRANKGVERIYITLDS